MFFYVNVSHKSDNLKPYNMRNYTFEYIFKIFGCNFPLWISEDTLTLFFNNRQTTCPKPLRKPGVVRERGRCLGYVAREPEPFISALFMLVNIPVPSLRKSAISYLCTRSFIQEEPTFLHKMCYLSIL